MNEKLPPLPPAYGTMSGTTAYTAKQMREYALAAIALSDLHRGYAAEYGEEFNAAQIRSYQEKQDD